MPSKLTRVKAFCLAIPVWRPLPEPSQDMRHSSAAYSDASRELRPVRNLAGYEHAPPLPSTLAGFWPDTCGPLFPRPPAEIHHKRRK